mgnify:CR=1 FL=1|jgi:Ca2+-binding EF-hand superfamily protein
MPPRSMSSSTGSIRLPPATKGAGISRPYTPAEPSRPVSHASSRRSSAHPQGLPPAYTDRRDMDALLDKLAAKTLQGRPDGSLSPRFADHVPDRRLLPSLSHPVIIPASAISPYDETTRLRRELVRVRRLCDAKLAAAEEEHRLRMERLHTELTGTSEEKQALLKQQAIEERLDSLRRHSVRRMRNRELSRCFSQWVDTWEGHMAHMQQLARLERAARMLKSPELGAAFRVWSLLVGSTKRAREREQLILAVASLEEKLARAEQETARALQRQLVELAGGTEEKEALRAEQEREQRVEYLRRQVMRRIMHKDLADGWTAWMAFWAARSYAVRRLRAVGNKLQAPALLETWEHWAREALETKRAAALAALEAESRSLEVQLQKARFEAGNLSMMKTQLEDERDHLKERVNELGVRLQEALNTLHASSSSSQQLEHLHKALKMAQDEAEALEAEKDALVNAGALHRKESERLLERLLADQRRNFEDEVHVLTEQAFARTEQMAKEARIAHFQRQALHRAKHHEVLRGWTQWLDWHGVRAGLLRTLHEGAKKTTRARLRIGFHGWLRGALAMREAKVRVEASRGCVALEASLEQAKAALALSEAETRQLLERLAMLQGNDPAAALLDAERIHQLQLVAEKEERVRLLYRQTGRRMRNRDLARGWKAWLEMWQAKTYARNSLHRVAKRLRAPSIASHFEFWSAELAQAKMRGLFQAARAREAAAASGVAAVRDEMEQLRQGFEQRLAAVEKAKSVELERQRIELVGGLEEQQAARDERARDEAVERRHRQSVRRMMNSAISRGWGAWMELWEAKSHAKQRLRQVAIKLQAPQLSSRFDEWARDAAAARQAARQAALELESRSLEMQLRRSRFETNQLEIIKVAHLDELRSLRERVELLSIASRDQQAKLEEDERLKGELRELRKFAAASKEAAETAEAARIAADADLLTHQQEMQELMERLLANQRKTFEEDKARMEQKVAAIEQKRGEADATADAAKEEVSTLHATLAATQTAAAQAAEKARLVLKAALTKAEQDGAMFESRISELLALAERSQQEAAQTQVATAKALQASEAKAAQVLAVTVKSFTADLEAATARSGELEAQLAQLQETSLHGSEGSSLKAQLESLRGAQVPSEKETIERLDKELKECQKLLMAAQKALKDKTPPPQPPPPPKAKKGTSKGTSILGRIDIDESPGAPPMTEQIATALRANSARVLDLFREWDTNGDGEVSRKEFHEAMDHLGFEVPTAEVDKLFDEWDSGSEGSLGYKNLTKILKKSTPAPPPSKLSTKLKAAGLASTVVKTVTMTPEEKEKAKRARMGGILGDVDFDEAKPLAPQLREALQKHAIRVLDLFREWDANGDGQISKDEFQKAMPMLGMDLPVNDINDLFDQYDPDKSGVMEFAELQRMLRRQPGEGAPHAAPTAAPAR